MELKPGRDLDALIAEKVMGWHRAGPNAFWPEAWCDAANYVQADADWAPSEDMSAAWRVVEFTVAVSGTPTLPNNWFAFWFDQAHLWAETEADAAFAICKAALLALEPPA